MSAVVRRAGSVQVGEVLLPDLPTGWPVAFDTEASGLYVDGDPGSDSGNPGSPPARVSSASIAFRDPYTGELCKYAWGFDQGPHPEKPGRIRRPREGGGAEPLDVDKMLTNLAKAGYSKGEEQVFSEKTGRPLKKLRPIPYTWQECYEAIGLHHWWNLLRWLRDRGLLIMHNGKYDLHIATAGPRDRLLRSEWEINPALRAVVGPVGESWLDHLIAFTSDDIGSHLGWDLDKVDRKVPREGRPFWDTMLVQYLFEPLESVALKKTCKRLRLGSGDTEQQKLLDAMGKQGTGLTKRYDLVPWFIMKDYAADDAELTLLLHECQQMCIEVNDLPKNYVDREVREYHLDMEFDLMRTLYRMEQRGLSYDVARSRVGAERLKVRTEQIEQVLPYDPHKLAEVKDYYFEQAEDGIWRVRKTGQNPLKLTEQTGGPCLDEAQLRVWIQSDSPPPYVLEYDEWSHCRSALGKWYRGWADRTGPDGRIRTSFRQCMVEDDRNGAGDGGTITGRLAVGRFQAQAIPHNGQLPEQVKDIPVRELIHARPGYLLYEMDLPQGEVRIATALANCTNMWDAIDRGEDLHGANATRIWGVKPGDERYEDLRNVGKRITFGTLYGAGIDVLRQQILDFTGIEYSRSETIQARNAFYEVFPEFRTISRGAEQKADKRQRGCGWLNMLDKRQRFFGPKEHTHKAFNALIQGNLAQTGKRWMNEVERELPGILLLQIHDSLLVEVPATLDGLAQARRAAEIGTDIHQEVYSLHGRHMPFVIELKGWDEVSKAWADKKTDRWDAQGGTDQ